MRIQVTGTPLTIPLQALYNIQQEYLPCNFEPPFPTKVRTKINNKFHTISLWRSFCTTHLQGEELHVTNIRVCSLVTDIHFWYNQLTPPASPTLEPTETTYLEEEPHGLHRYG